MTAHLSPPELGCAAKHRAGAASQEFAPGSWAKGKRPTDPQGLVGCLPFQRKSENFHNRKRKDISRTRKEAAKEAGNTTVGTGLGAPAPAGAAGLVSYSTR